LSVAAENLAATESGIRDTNMAQEMTNLVRSQILSQVGLLAVQSHNTNARNILDLLGVT
ncbi:MAG: flagellin FliC, partial [Planctomycetes bacterium]|nr:flagellin FliC [Planctomycetota bacterium]